MNDFLFSYGLAVSGASITDGGQLNIGLEKGCSATIGDTTPKKLAAFCINDLGMNVKRVLVDSLYAFEVDDVKVENTGS